MKKIIICLYLCLLSILDGFAQEMSSLWQIGQKDKSAAEFALGPFDYAGFTKKFGHNAILYEIGKDKAADFPFVIPGPSDNWAGNASKQILICFGIKDITEPCKARLDMDFVETHPAGAPVFEIMINGFRQDIRIPGGNDQDYFTNKRKNENVLHVEVNIPENTLKKGNNLVTIRSKSGSWAVFDYISLNAANQLALEKPATNISFLNAEVLPALIYGKNREVRRPVKLTIVNTGNKQSANLLVDGQNTGKITLQKGINSIDADFPEVEAEKEISIGLSAGSKSVEELTAKVSPVKLRTVYLMQHTHTDIGYTKPQTEILAEHIRYIDYAIEYCELTEDYPDDAKFRWTCEAAWAVKEYIMNRPKVQIDKFIKYIKNGRIEVAGMFFNMSEIVDENSFKTFFEPLRLFKDLGIPVKTAIQNDVNGIAWCLADYLPDLGINYFTMGENGHRALIPFDRPTLYKWESPSGKFLYSYRSDHYMTANFWGIDRAEGVEQIAPALFGYLNTLTAKNYPFDAVGVQYSGYFTDNSPPSMHESRIIREWNDKYASPKLRSALFHEFMDDVTARYGDRLPVIRAAYPDWWTDGFGSAARETAASRKTHADMITIQGLLSMAVLKGQTLPAQTPDKIRHTHENLLFYDEHTYGAAESISDPTCDNSEVQWAEKASYVWEALKNAQIMYETSAGLLQNFMPRGEHPTVTFFNTLNWPRSGMLELYIDHEIIPDKKAFRMEDEAGNVIKMQYLHSRREGSYYAVYPENIPAMGYKTYSIIVGKENVAEALPANIRDFTVENEYFKITLDPEKGDVKSLFDKQLQLELVDAASPWKLGAFVYETLGNRRQMELYTLTDYERNGMSDIRISAGDNGPIYQSIRIQGKSACCDDGFGVKIEIRLFHNEKRIELHYAAKKLPVTDPDGIYVAFPFKLDNAKLYFDVQGGVVSPGENQIEGTASDWNTVQNFVTARNDKAQFVVGSNLIPLFQMGGICTGQYQRKKTYDYPHVYSWVTNNYWTTNFRASQEGELRWSYYLTATGDTSNSFASRFGWSSRVPLYARVAPAGKPNRLPASYSAFRFNSDNFLMTSATPAREKGYILINVRELDGKQTPFHLLDNAGNALEFSIVNLIEDPIKTGLRETTVPPFGNMFIKFKM
ncbi:MAG: hypothetical protein LBL07_13860 [Tannerella sp.]|jgi:hypothetical protein|nr:hypothetical protein [Tannerella sp.]